MGDLSLHFSRSEFACKGENCCGGSAPIDGAIISRLESVREKVSALLGKDTKLHINSGFRCNVHNREIGSTNSSQHTRALAVDVDHPESIEEAVFYAIMRPLFNGIGRYDSFTHGDIRSTSTAEWDKRTKTEPAHVT